MANEVIFTSVKYNADNKVLEKDDKGYYLITLGALNVFNSAGEYYTANGVRDMFTDKSSSLMRRLGNGFLKAEVGHPKLQPGMSKTDFFNRNLRIEETNTCAHIRDLILVDTNTPSGIGNEKIILIKGWVKPAGPKGDFLQKAFDDPDENIAFSVRSFTNNKLVGTNYIKTIAQLVTFDYVTEPGIEYATKRRTLGVESRDSFTMDICDISNEDSTGLNICYECSLESNDEKELVKELIHNVNSNTNSNNKSILDNW